MNKTLAIIALIGTAGLSVGTTAALGATHSNAMYMHSVHGTQTTGFDIVWGNGASTHLPGRDAALRQCKESNVHSRDALICKVSTFDDYRMIGMVKRSLAHTS